MLRSVALSVVMTALCATTLSGTVDAPAGAQTPLAAAAAHAARPFVPIPGAVFGDPYARHNMILVRLLANIAHTPRGATIRIVGYSFSLGNVATALLKAHRRGVNVQVVVDGHSRVWSPAHRMVPVLGRDVTRRSFFVLTHGSARGTGGVTHQKSWTFSRVGSTPDVVMVGSTNLTGYGTEVQYSDTFVYTNRPDVYRVYNALFARQKQDRPVARPFVTDTFAHGSVYFFPRPGTTAATDPAMARIAALPAAPGTAIRVAQFAWYGVRGQWLASALAAKKRGGADVTVVAGQAVALNIRRVLGNARIPVYGGVFRNGKRIHCKLMLASFQRGRRTHNAIWTGSDNWAKQSFHNDDDVLQIDDDVAAYRGYTSFFGRLTARAGVPMPPPGVSRTSLTIRRTVATVRLHRRAFVFGTMLPVYAGRRVLVQRHRARAAAWHTVLRSPPLTGSASYRLGVPTDKVGSWRYRTIVEASPTALAAESRTVNLRVTR